MVGPEQLHSIAEHSIEHWLEVVERRVEMTRGGGELGVASVTQVTSPPLGVPSPHSNTSRVEYRNCKVLSYCTVHVHGLGDSDGMELNGLELGLDTDGVEWSGDCGIPSRG